MFRNKVKNCNTISLIEKFTAITTEEKLAKTFNEIFVNISPNLGINTHNVNEVVTSQVSFMTSIIDKYRHHPSIKAIKSHMEKIDNPNFSFMIWDMENI